MNYQYEFEWQDSGITRILLDQSLTGIIKTVLSAYLDDVQSLDMHQASVGAKTWLGAECDGPFLLVSFNRPYDWQLCEDEDDEEIVSFACLAEPASVAALLTQFASRVRRYRESFAGRFFGKVRATATHEYVQYTRHYFGGEAYEVEDDDRDIEPLPGLDYHGYNYARETDEYSSFLLDSELQSIKKQMQQGLKFMPEIVWHLSDSDEHIELIDSMRELDALDLSLPDYPLDDFFSGLFEHAHTPHKRVATHLLHILFDQGFKPNAICSLWSDQEFEQDSIDGQREWLSTEYQSFEKHMFTETLLATLPGKPDAARRIKL